MEQQPLSRRVIGLAIDVHRILGPGLLESAYEECLAYELAKKGLHAQRQISVSIKYKELTIVESFRMDMLVEDTLVLELKAAAAIGAVHRAQMLTYLKFAEKPLGLLINFHSTKLSDGIERFIRSEFLAGSRVEDL